MNVHSSILATSVVCIVACANAPAPQPSPASLDTTATAKGTVATPMIDPEIAREEQLADAKHALRKKEGGACTQKSECVGAFCDCVNYGVATELLCESGKCASPSETCKITCAGKAGGLKNAPSETPEVMVLGDECSAYCARQRSLSCYNPEHGSCERQCSAVVGCEKEKRAHMKCFGAFPTDAFKCNGKGTYSIPGCSTELSASIDCEMRVQKEMRDRHH